MLNATGWIKGVYDRLDGSLLAYCAVIYDSETGSHVEGPLRETREHAQRDLSRTLKWAGWMPSL